MVRTRHDLLAVKIRLYYIGKPRSREADLPAEEYAKRISRFCRFEMIAAKTEKAIALSPKAFKVVLDPEDRRSPPKNWPTCSKRKAVKSTSPSAAPTDSPIPSARKPTGFSRYRK